MNDKSDPSEIDMRHDDRQNSESDPFQVLQNLQNENATLLEEVANLKDRLMRSLAEMENLRRRTEKEIADAKIYGITGFARDCLALADNLHRALETVSPQLRSEADPVLASFVEGVELTERDFISRLMRHGVKKLEPEGVKFDPNLHEALFEIPDETVPSGLVLQVMEPGYIIGERVLRPAKVGVSRGGTKA